MTYDDLSTDLIHRKYKIQKVIKRTSPIQNDVVSSIVINFL